ncbi:MAG TPA: hypothetical protein VFV98_07660 [Vicinamibacterales bacterium]|nr:hypothetical protein [Vicinamibacterales bacterium]
MRASIGLLVVAAAGLLMAPALASAQLSPERTLKLSFDADGLVTLRAQNVRPSEIMIEWKRLCQCAVVDGEKLTAGPIVTPLVFDNAPQAMVLETLLRQAAGVILTPKRAGAAGPSNFETIYVIATSNPTTGGYASAYNPVATPPYQSNISSPGNPADEIPPVAPNGPPRPNNTPYAPGVVNAPGPAATSASPGSVFVPVTPIGSSTTPPKPGGGGTTPPIIKAPGGGQ